MNTIEAIATESIPVVPPKKTEVLEAGKGSESTITAEPTTADVAERSKQTNKKSIRRNSNASVII